MDIALGLLDRLTGAAAFVLAIVFLCLLILLIVRYGAFRHHPDQQRFFYAVALLFAGGVASAGLALLVVGKIPHIATEQGRLHQAIWNISATCIAIIAVLLTGSSVLRFVSYLRANRALQRRGGEQTYLAVRHMAVLPFPAPGGLPSVAVTLVAALVMNAVPQIATAPQSFRNPVWNVWAERSSAFPSFEPTALEPEHDYSLVINLASLRYSDSGTASVVSRDVSSSFARWLELHSDIEAADVDVVLLPNIEYIQLLETKVKRLHIDIAKMRHLRHDGFASDSSPFKFLQSHGSEAPFSFGLQSFRIRTTTKSGNTSVAIAIWADGIPVDDLSVSFCIAPPAHRSCSVESYGDQTGVDLTGTYADFGLQLIERGDVVTGVIHCNVCASGKGEYREWDGDRSADWISGRMKEIIRLVGQVKNSVATSQIQQMEQVGTEIYNVIFHSHDPRSDEAKQVLAEFMEYARVQGEQSKPAPSLFARIMPRRPDLLLAPIALMRVVLSDNSSEFVGFQTNMWSPLEDQNYSPAADCISDWVMFVPPGTKPAPLAFETVSDARDEFSMWISAFKQFCKDCVKEDENEFQRWLGQSGSPESHAVLILSHHSANGLFFNQYTELPKILSSAVTRRFAAPSFVVLDACGTSEPGDSEFIREFNSKGVGSAIATSTEVEPALAGRFLAEFMTLLRQHANDKDYLVNQARFEAVRKLGKEPRYGPKALAFILAGNGALRLCIPPEAYPAPAP